MTFNVREQTSPAYILKKNHISLCILQEDEEVFSKTDYSSMITTSKYDENILKSEKLAFSSYCVSKKHVV